MALEAKDLEVGEKVFVYGFPGKVVRIYDEGVDIEVAGVIERYYEFDEIEKSNE